MAEEQPKVEVQDTEELTLTKTYELVTFEQRGRVGLITLNRPKALNALCDQLMMELCEVAQLAANHKSIGAIVITGSEKAFAAGADIKEMAHHDFRSCYTCKMLDNWRAISDVRVPIIAAVNGFALGGGLELALSCDVIYAGEKAKFGQVEITVGIIPGCGGTQRLIRAVGKSTAMEMSLTCDHLKAEEALQRGLVSKIYAPEELVDKAVECAQKMAKMPKEVSCMVKDTINAAYEMPLSQGLDYEKRMFWGCFGTYEQKEGMAAFIEKRKPDWKN